MTDATDREADLTAAYTAAAEAIHGAVSWLIELGADSTPNNARSIELLAAHTLPEYALEHGGSIGSPTVEVTAAIDQGRGRPCQRPREQLARAVVGGGMSVDHDTTFAYGLTLTTGECRTGLAALGKPAGTDPEQDDYVEEPFWDLAMALGLEWARFGNSYESAPDAVKYVIGPKLMWVAASVTCEAVGLAAIMKFARDVFPNKTLGWVHEVDIH